MFALNPCVWRRKDSQNTNAGETLVQAHAGANTWCKHTLVQAHVCPRVFPMVMTFGVLQPERQALDQQRVILHAADTDNFGHAPKCN